MLWDRPLFWEGELLDKKIKELEEMLVKQLVNNSSVADIGIVVKEAIEKSEIMEAKTKIDDAIRTNMNYKKHLRPTYFDPYTYNCEQKADPNNFYYRQCHEMIIEHHQLKKELTKLKCQSDENSIQEENSDTLELKNSGLLKRHRSGHNYIDTHSGKMYYPAVDEANHRTKGNQELNMEIYGSKRRLSKSDLQFNMDLLPFDLNSDGELLEADPNPPKKRKLPPAYKKGSYFTCTISPCNYLIDQSSKFRDFKIYYSRPINAFETSEELRNHVMQHHQQSCASSWSNEDDEYHPGTDVHTVFCDECPWSGSHDSFLNHHEKSTTHKKDYETSKHTFECKLCEIKVASRNILLNHNKKFHLI